MKELTIKKNTIITALTALILFTRCNLGLTRGLPVVGANLIACGLGFLFCLALLFGENNQSKAYVNKGAEPKATAKGYPTFIASIRQTLLNPVTIWIVLFTVLLFIYGLTRYGNCYTEMFSRQYILLTMAPALLIMVMLQHADDIVDVLAKAGSVVIVTTLITSLIYDPVWQEWVNGTISESRTGATPAGTCVDTGNLMLVLLIPIIYELYINKKYKLYIGPTLLGIFEIFASASKSSMFPLVLVFAIMIIGSAKEKRVLRRNIIILLVVAVAGFAALMTVPALYRIIGNRIVEMFTAFGATEYDLHTSTGQRQAIGAAVREHFWEAPLFGHGFYAFKLMDYAKLEEYKENGQVLYRAVQTHNNFYELLFSFGIVGFVVYYWLPAWLVIKTFFCKNKKAIILVASFLISFLSMDMGIDMFFKYLTPYFTYMVCYLLLSKDSQAGALKEEN